MRVFLDGSYESSVDFYMTIYCDNKLCMLTDVIFSNELIMNRVHHRRPKIKIFCLIIATRIQEKNS